MLAIGGFVLLVIVVPLRIWSTFRLMRRYSVDEYVTDRHARMLWLLSICGAPFIGVAVLLMAASTGIWWVITAAAAFAGLVLWTTAWKIWMRVTGRYREHYRAMQWSGPAH